MVQWHENIEPNHAEWIKKQKLFFVATAPLDGRGSVNSSPKGHDCLRVLGPNQVCYLELSGSGIETQSHIEENGRITVMLTAFEGPPRIMRLFGTGRVVRLESPEYNKLMQEHYVGSELYNAHGKRGIIMVDVHKVSTSCGYAVPYFDYKGPRNTLVEVYGKRSDEVIKSGWLQKNKYSIDGLPGMRHELLGPEWTGKNRGAGEPVELPAWADRSNQGKGFLAWIQSGTGLANATVLSAGIAIGFGLATGTGLGALIRRK
ncbi:hypothetical protein BGX34_003893 [Mortierella sp. NVP85]|nr:hypothetical protein BGX34_003893 [Mortierella sp. NVP85]